MLRICKALLLALIFFAKPAFADDDTLFKWHSSEGDRVIVGKFVRLTEKGVLILRETGSEVDIAFKYLSADDVTLSKQLALRQALRDDAEQYRLLRDAFAEVDAPISLDEKRLLEIELQYPHSSYASILLAIKFCSPDPVISRKALKHANVAVERLSEFMKLSKHHHQNTFISALSIRACASHLCKDYETELQSYLISIKYLRSELPPFLSRNIVNFIDLCKAGVARVSTRSAIAILEKHPSTEMIPGERGNNYVLRQIDIPTENGTLYDVILREKTIPVPISQNELLAAQKGHAKVSDRNFEMEKEELWREEIKKAKRNSFPPVLQGLWCIIDVKQGAKGEYWEPDITGEPTPFANVIGNQVWLIDRKYTATVVDWKLSYIMGKEQFSILLSDGVTWNITIDSGHAFLLEKSDSKISAHMRNMSLTPSFAPQR